MTKIAGSGSRSGSGFIRQKEEWIRGSGSTPKCQGSATLLFCSHPGAEDLKVRPVTAAGAAEELTLDVWGDACRGLDQGPAAGRWLSRIIAGDPEAENPNRHFIFPDLFLLIKKYRNFL